MAGSLSSAKTGEGEQVGSSRAPGFQKEKTAEQSTRAARSIPPLGEGGRKAGDRRYSGDRYQRKEVNSFYRSGSTMSYGKKEKKKRKEERTTRRPALFDNFPADR